MILSYHSGLRGRGGEGGRGLMMDLATKTHFDSGKCPVLLVVVIA